MFSTFDNISVGDFIPDNLITSRQGHTTQEVYTMDLFKEYGMTKEELLNTLSDAINFIDRHDDGDTDGLSDRLFEVIGIVQELTKEYNK